MSPAEIARKDADASTSNFLGMCIPVVPSIKTVAWDAEAVYACVCDPAREVGLGPGQRQEAECFRADYSQREAGFPRCWLTHDPRAAFYLQWCPAGTGENFPVFYRYGTVVSWQVFLVHGPRVVCDG